MERQVSETESFDMALLSEACPEPCRRVEGPLVLSLPKDQDRPFDKAQSLPRTRSGDKHLYEALPETEAALLRSAEVTVRAYLRQLGFGEAVTESVLPQCLIKARKRVGRGPATMKELQRRAVEEVQRRLDRSLGHLLGFAGDDLPNLARARAALLLDAVNFPKDHLLTGQPVSPELVQTLAAHLPTATPPEAPLPMKAQKFHFIFRR